METISSLEPKIRAILAAPGTDLTTISAKRVRKQLVEVDHSLSAEYLRQNKAVVDRLITRIYEEVSSVAGDRTAPEQSEHEDRKPANANGHGKNRGRKRAHEDEGEDEGEDEVATPPPKIKKARKADVELSDAELARQLSNELNGRQRSSRASAAKPAGAANGAKKIKRRMKKSAATVDSDGDGSGGDTPKKKRGGGFQKEYLLSEPLSALLNVEKMSRPQVVKQLWVHIKGNELQNPKNKREIICDDAMRAIFAVDKIDMFKMNKVLGQHLHEP